MKKILLLFIAVFTSTLQSNAFCGFYVARADVKLFNKTSQVILVRNGERSTITMSSDFQGNVKDFAMVIPVPTVLQREDIRVVERSIFDQFDAYSGPRLVEYHDQAPCNRYMLEDAVLSKTTSSMRNAAAEMSRDEEKEEYHVAVIARYTVDEYDIEILSAKESGGLERWLNDHGYKIPEGAREVLEPYIKSNMKFFVVKVNLEEQQRRGNQILRPLQISFHSPKFMLPIRLGMANGGGNQDMIIYAFSQKGRIETTNYRTLQMPTDRNVPVFVKDYFGQFYTSLYKENIRKEGGNNIYLEYAWDLSGQNQVKCDPCASQPPLYSEIVQSGVDWLQTGRGNGYTGQLYFTRLHVTYNRQDFPQDLVFQETSNKAQFQCRYILNHPSAYVDNCPEWSEYQDQKIQKRRKELRELASLTGWDVSRYRDYPGYFSGYRAPQPPDKRTGWMEPPTQPEKSINKKKLNPFQSNPDPADVAQFDDGIIPDSGVGISQESFLSEDTMPEKTKKEIPFAMIALTTITGLFLYHRIKS